MEPEEALHLHILRRKKDGVEDWIDTSVEKIGAVPTLNQVLLPAMKEVGDKFGAGELILPFVLQSAEVMKRAVAQLENYLDRIEGHTKGKVVIATVFGDVHDIGKSLVNTILTNNGYTVIDLGKQVPVDTIINAAVEHEADAIGLSALLVSTSKQMPTCVQELHERGLEFPVLIGGAAINRDFGRRILYPTGKESDEVYEPGVFYCKDAFQGLDTMDALVEEEARGALVAKAPRRGAQAAREARGRGRRAAVDDDSVRSASRTDVPVPEPPVLGRARDRRSTSTTVYPYLDRHVLFKLHWGGRGKKGEEWRRLVEGDGDEEGFAPRLERMWREQDYLRPRAKLGYFPCGVRRQRAGGLRPRGPRARDRAAALPAPAQARPHLPGRLLPPARLGRARRGRAPGRDRRPRGHRADGAAGEATASSPSSCTPTGSGVQSAEGLAEWLHARGPPRAGHRPRPGPPLLVGLPRLPGPVRAREGLAPARPRGDRHDLSDGYAVMPEQSTVAIIAHHPQAVYFGMKSGFVPEDKAPDELIAGTERGGELPPEADPADGVVEDEVPADEVPAWAFMPRAVGLRLRPQLGACEGQRRCCFSLRAKAFSE